MQKLQGDNIVGHFWNDNGIGFGQVCKSMDTLCMLWQIWGINMAIMYGYMIQNVGTEIL